MTYQEVLENARAVLSKNCKACPVCNGKACGNHIPGPGAKGVGDTAIRNFEKWQAVRVNMDTIHPCVTPDTSLYLFSGTIGHVDFVTAHCNHRSNGTRKSINIYNFLCIVPHQLAINRNSFLYASTVAIDINANGINFSGFSKLTAKIFRSYNFSFFIMSFTNLRIDVQIHCFFIFLRQIPERPIIHPDHLLLRHLMCCNFL